MTITATPITPRFGAEISGVDISKPLDADTVAELIAQQDRWGVTVYRNTGLDDEGQIAFARNFGHLESLPPREGRPRIFLFNAGNLNAQGEINWDPGATTYRKGDQIWHTDSSFMDLRTSYSMLRAVEVPPSGGPTWFADARSAYDDLPQDVKDKIENLECEHSLWWSRKQGGAEISREDIEARHRPVHKLVHVHKGSGRKMIYAGAHCYRVVGWGWEESRELIDYLNNFATQDQYAISVDYAVGDMVIWDNLAVFHKGGQFDWNERRDMRRATVREAPAPEVEDDPFGELFRTAPPISPKGAAAA
ncbi:alpha-ketoglutarate-dependent 2,4-dichlorophenoxyacetate dioxygenase [Sphingobium sp. B2D3A]|uniref:TauD/TfdA dioxygenase family protein n=1 Tax=unclassified Sphingobium TaxID=2611147 RepID=UPI002225857A|nr:MULTISPECIES: TauD/TfdA family dioxygenase [unclassified Sphingobium]MCW2337140.1 alpha-ketoglutarate-dependent 2,4-dichlorophenoxyacetate dioxygenase [Sphingobium sp. B2D3A]MCW2383598.1 alpha-ketoglutarate-dependent 2,4-dichlorophenoxyacetate dioxygenase [Sphingobium sp. B2D3D]MCW2393168.1 alpha-ketoglutarate-dependent 2,4-dichlorophenoxyacetate dioxygenase [Sphingobium sp. B11D3A]MCW2404972.1 alpha-ketoglutarate-dependent 2,4-dichlorophenoxyacetate dioxygenase [Sphingobium sp. B1D7B]